MIKMNSCLLEGNLAQDPQSRVVAPSGTTVCTFTIAHDRLYRNQKKELVTDTTFVDVETWGPLAENCAKYLKKGKAVRVVGRLKQSVWTGKEDGKTHSRLFIAAEHVEFGRNPKSSEATEAPEEEFPEEAPINL